jgi:hypothetical protein
VAAFVHCERGFGRLGERETRLAKTIEYAKKALEYPLDVPTSCRLYGYLGDALTVKGKRGPRDDWLQARQEAVTVCLKGLKLALDNKAPREMPAPPSVGPNAFGPDGRTQEGALPTFEEQKAARKQYYQLRALHMQRRALSNRAVILYSEEPYDVDQFRAIALEVLGKHQDVAHALTQEVQARIATRKRPSMPPSPVP